MRDEILFELIAAEEKRQQDGLELIPSENYVSKAVREAMGSVLNNKYSEGYPDFSKLEGTDRAVIEATGESHRYYGGQAFTDRIERLAIARAKRIFNADHANLQPHSGAQANNAVYAAWLKPGDTVLGLDLGHGGHLTHGAKVTQSAQFYRFVPYHTVAQTGELDYVEIASLLKKYQPKIFLVGYSAFAKIPDFKRLAQLGKEVPGCLLMADMAHVAGLIAGGVHPNPLNFGFQVMTTTTHKTLRGPRGGMILSRGKVSNPLKPVEKSLVNIPTLIDRAVFPGTQGGPLMQMIAAKAVMLFEAEQPAFKLYATQIIKNAHVLAEALKEKGFKLVGDGTSNHLILADMKQSFDLDGKIMEKLLDKMGLTLNANAVPNDPLPPFRPSGIRLGVPAVTTRGMREKEMLMIAGYLEEAAKICKEAKQQAEDGTTLTIGEILKDDATKIRVNKIREEVRLLARAFPLP